MIDEIRQFSGKKTVELVCTDMWLTVEPVCTDRWLTVAWPTLDEIYTS